MSMGTLPFWAASNTDVWSEVNLDSKEWQLLRLGRVDLSGAACESAGRRFRVARKTCDEIGLGQCDQIDAAV